MCLGNKHNLGFLKVKILLNLKAKYSFFLLLIRSAKTLILGFFKFLYEKKRVLMQTIDNLLPTKNYPQISERFNWVVKFFLIFFYISCFFFYLHVVFYVKIDSLTLKDFFMLLKLEGFYYFFLFFLSFLSSCAWLPNYKKVMFRDILNFFIVFVLYHTFYVVIFMSLPGFFL